MISREALREKVLKVIEERFKVNPELISDDSDLRSSLDLDSIDLFDLVAVFETEFSLRIDIENFVEIRTVGQFVDKLRQVLIDDAK